MDQDLISALKYQKYSELDSYFYKDPYLSIRISTASPSSLMELGFINNTIGRFWRLLKVNDLLVDKMDDTEYCLFLLETFLNQCLSCSDALATAMNIFFHLQVPSTSLSIHNDRFFKAIEDKLADYPEIGDLITHHNWVKIKLYPFRNISHHMGDPCTLADFNFQTLKVQSVLIPKEDQWDFVQLRADLKGYPDQTTYRIVTNTMQIPNMLTGDDGEPEKYYPINLFFSEWIMKIHSLYTSFFEGLVWYQRSPIQ